MISLWPKFAVLVRSLVIVRVAAPR
uniref:Uncharacterized protein n=1 Tax=Anopheles minimus TaxID=112268 RepID=A0A182WPG8_9DIPT